MSIQIVSLTCATRALKNAEYLQKVAPHIMPRIEPAEGFDSVIPLQLLAQLDKPDRINMTDACPHLAELLQDVKFPITTAEATGPLFKGTLFFLHIFFTIQDQNNTVVYINDQDISVVVDYANRAGRPISQYAAQYGPNSIDISSQIIPYAVTLATAKYNDAQLRAWVDDVASQLKTTRDNCCIVVLNPPGVVNTDADPAKGWGGYHRKANVPYIFSNVLGQNLTLRDEPFAYAGILSHEIAEMVVDPRVDGSNPEVCDPCGPNCASTFLDYFDDAGNYIATSQAFPPSFPYQFYINGIIKPESGSCQEGVPDPNFACNYGPIVHTDVAPAVVGVGYTVFFFQKSLDKRIFYNWAKLGQNFQGWTVVNGRGSTDTAPAAGAVGNYIFVGIKDSEGTIQINQGSGLGAIPFLDYWSSLPLPMDLKTDASPSLVGAGDKIFLFVKTLDKRIFYNWAKLGQSFQGWKEIDGNGNTDTAPAAGAVGDYIFVGIKDSEGTIQINQGSGLGTIPFVGWRPLGGPKTDASPSLVGAGDKIFLFVKTLDKRIFYNWAKLGQSFQGWAEVDGNGSTDSAPAAGAVGSYIFVGIKGPDGTIQVNQGSGLGTIPFVGWQSVT